MICQLCMVYFDAERVSEKTHIGGGKEIVIINRYCPHRKSIVNEEDDACEKFEPTKWMWCKGWESWVTVEGCQHRQNKDQKPCPCGVGVEAQGIVISKAPPTEPAPKKQLLIRKPKKMLVVRKKP